MTYREADALLRPREQPKKPRRRARRTPAESREQILRAATKEFVTHGFAGARVSRIVGKAGSNPRMLYHYFGSKSQLYIAVLEEALAGLRRRELEIDVEHLDPREGLLQLFDFLVGYFEHNRHLVRLLSAENMLKAKYMRKSSRIPEMSSPVLSMIERFIARGAEAGQLPQGLDGLRLYVLMVALSQFHLSNGYTLSTIFGRDLYDPVWRAARGADARGMLAQFLKR
ncbi:MAG: TetR/AcrR family transcriptional regulator [Xanthobacteraceae bacterium]